MKSLKVLFVCLGNTCRSPMAECLLSHLIDLYALDWETDSAALRTWNVGMKPDERCLKVLEENGLISTHIGRMDFSYFDYIFGMDELNIKELNAMSETLMGKAKIELLGTYIGREEDKEIEDPYFSTGMGGFRCVYVQIKESLQNFIKQHSDKMK